MTNDKCNMENGKSLPLSYGSSELSQGGGLHSLHVLIHPRDHLPQRVFDRFAGGVSVRFERQRHVADIAAVALDRLIHPVALNRVRAGVVVGLAVDEQDRRLELVRIHERRDFEIHLWRFPESAALALESERRERAVVRAAAGDAGLE